MRELGINVEETAIMSAVTPIAAIVMPPLAGMFADRVGNFRVNQRVFIRKEKRVMVCRLTMVLFYFIFFLLSLADIIIILFFSWRCSSVTSLTRPNRQSYSRISRESYNGRELCR